MSEFKNRSHLGDYAECLVMTTLIKHGFNVMRTFNSGVRYDLLAEKKGKFLRIQVKCAWFNHKKNAIDVRLKSGCGSKKRPWQGYTKLDADVFIIYCVHVDKLFIVPIGSKIFRLRVCPPNKNGHNIKLASDYEFDVDKLDKIMRKK